MRLIIFNIFFRFILYIFTCTILHGQLLKTTRL